jgi:hypothetical protein
MMDRHAIYVPPFRGGGGAAGRGDMWCTRCKRNDHRTDQCKRKKEANGSGGKKKNETGPRYCTLCGFNPDDPGNPGDHCDQCGILFDDKRCSSCGFPDETERCTCASGSGGSGGSSSSSIGKTRFTRRPAEGFCPLIAASRDAVSNPKEVFAACSGRPYVTAPVMYVPPRIRLQEPPFNPDGQGPSGLFGPTRALNFATNGFTYDPVEAAVSARAIARGDWRVAPTMARGTQAWLAGGGDVPEGTCPICDKTWHGSHQACITQAARSQNRNAIGEIMKNRRPAETQAPPAQAPQNRCHGVTHDDSTCQNIVKPPVKFCHLHTAQAPITDQCNNEIDMITQVPWGDFVDSSEAGEGLENLVMIHIKQINTFTGKTMFTQSMCYSRAHLKKYLTTQAIERPGMALWSKRMNDSGHGGTASTKYEFVECAGMPDNWYLTLPAAMAAMSILDAIQPASPPQNISGGTAGFPAGFDDFFNSGFESEYSDDMPEPWVQEDDAPEDELLGGGGILEITLYRSMVPIPVGNVDNDYIIGGTHGNTEAYVYFASEEEARQFEDPMFSVKFEDIFGKDQMSLPAFTAHPLFGSGTSAAEQHRKVNLKNLKRLLDLMSMGGDNQRLHKIFQKKANDARKEWEALFSDKDLEALREQATRCQSIPQELSIGGKVQNILQMWLRGGSVIRVPEDYSTLEEAVAKVHGDDGLDTIVVGKGEHVVAVYEDEDGDESNTLEISSAMNIVGDPGVPRSEIVVVGGIYLKPGIPGNCHLQHLTLRQANMNGVRGKSSFTMDDVLVEQCGYAGVKAGGTGVAARCTDVEVRQCGGSGVFAFDGASITLIGAKTTVHHNCTAGDSDDYGLGVYSSSSSTIQLVSPLTKEQVSTDNGGGGNWGASNNGGDISQIQTIDRNIVRVPGDCATLKEAVGRVRRDDGLDTIVVGKGEHVVAVYENEDDVESNTLEISSAMNIVGDPGVPKEEIVVVGGIMFEEGIPGNCHLQHLTLRQTKTNGVSGYSSFTMEDVLVERCKHHGVCVVGTGVVGRCTNVEVRQCGWSGVLVVRCRSSYGASITLIGAKTTVHHNCTAGSSDHYGLHVDGSSSTIQLVSPLTKEQVSTYNGGGGNWGASNGGDISQIQTIDGSVVRVPGDYSTLN